MCELCYPAWQGYGWGGWSQTDGLVGPPPAGFGGWPPSGPLVPLENFPPGAPPGWPYAYVTGQQQHPHGGPSSHRVKAALSRLQHAVDMTDHGHGSLADVQAAFDGLRSAMKSTWPSGGPNGPVG